MLGGNCGIRGVELWTHLVGLKDPRSGDGMVVMQTMLPSLPFERPSGDWDVLPGFPKLKPPTSLPRHCKEKTVPQKPVPSVIIASAKSKPQTT